MANPSSTPAPPSSSIPPDFANDPRLHFSRETNSWRFEDDDGTEMEWDVTKKAWVPVVRLIICEAVC
jgi:HIV Tat-specific factor 1